jgi:outer membrane protein
MPYKSLFHTCALSFGLSLILSTSVLGQAGSAKSAAGAVVAGAPATNAKIGIVNMQEAISVTNEGKKEFSALQAQFAPKQNSLKSLNDEVESLKKDFQANGVKLNEDERAKKAKNLEAKQKTLQRTYEDAQNEFQQAERKVVSRIGEKMMVVLEKYAQNHGYTLILDVSNPQTPVLWARQGMIITKQLVDAYNAESQGAAAPARPAGAIANPKPAGSITAPKKP